MKTDKELLELAAKAADYNIKSHEDGTLYSDCRCAGYWGVWNPLTDDGDALRLAVELNLGVDISDTWVDIFHNGKCIIADTVTGDKLAATRRAIVRAAAAIGERL